MPINKKQIQDLFLDIRTGKAALLLGQEYFRIDDDYYEKVLCNLKIKDDKPSLNQLWMSYNSQYDTLKNALCYAAENSEYKPWLRTLLSLGWNVILSSSINNEWIKNGVGQNFSLIIQTQGELPDNVDFYKTFSKKQPHYISLYSDEKSIPNHKIELLKLKKKTALLGLIYDQMLSSYDGYLVVDGIAEDDWFDIGRLTENIDNIPYGCIFIFGMNDERLERVCHNDNDLPLIQEYIKNSQIILVEKSLKDTIIEFGLVTEDEENDEFEHDNEVRISLSNDDSLWIPRLECNRLSSISITLMRDEILNQLILTDDNKEKYFADFLQQHDKKNWNFFDISYKREPISFHVSRDVEGFLENAVTNQLDSSNNKREIILLKGNSNSGKTTSLSWFAWHAVKEGFKKKKNTKYIVFYISGDPTHNDIEWQNILSEFIKNNIYSKTTTKGDRIRNVIIIWDNYNGMDKKAEYIQLYNNLNDCNAILIGSIYSFESPSNTSSIVQGVAFNELKPLNSRLEPNAKNKFETLLKTINQNWALEASQSGSDYLFEKIINFAKYNYSPVWEQVRQTMRAGLSKEATLTEKVSDDLFSIFKDKNADDIFDVEKTVLRLGVGAKVQSQFIEADIDRQKTNTPFINSIRDMNLILAVAGQFNKAIRLPISVLLRTILKEKEYKGDRQKLNKILRSDSMVEYDANTSTGNTFVSFRHPSEAIAYLDNNFGADRKRKEIDVIIRIIKNCRWDIFEEARAVSTFVRSFGTNSYGKYGEENPNTHGHYNEYSEYWLEIVQALRQCATDNAEAMLIAGHFTRDFVETHPSYEDIDTLNNALNGMISVVDSCTVKSTCARLYGEICRNLLQQIKITDDRYKVEGLSFVFEADFKLAVKNGKESKLNNNSFSMIQLLDIWLNYVLNDKARHRQNQLIPDTLEYIDLLFYNESTLIDDSEDYVNVISSINKIYEIIDSKQESDLRDIFKNANNDSYVYCIAKQVLIRTYFDCREKNFELFADNNDHVLSSRVFFLNENAANDFEQFRSLKQNDAQTGGYEINTLGEKFIEIKQRLHDASKKIIDILTAEYISVEKMSFRCLVLYLKAKWMYYTNNFLLENEQYPALSNKQWLELNNICSVILTNKRDNDVVPRSVSFIQNIYRFVFEGERWNQHRYPSEMPNRLICLCADTGTPRTFKISVYEDNYNKLKARIDYEVINGEKTTKTSIFGQKNVFVPVNIRNYRDLRRSNLNIDRDFVIWFNLGGPQIQDNSSKEGV